MDSPHFPGIAGNLGRVQFEIDSFGYGNPKFLAYLAFLGFLVTQDMHGNSAIQQIASHMLNITQSDS